MSLRSKSLTEERLFDAPSKACSCKLSWRRPFSGSLTCVRRLRSAPKSLLVDVFRHFVNLIASQPEDPGRNHARDSRFATYHAPLSAEDTPIGVFGWKRDEKSA